MASSDDDSSVLPPGLGPLGIEAFRSYVLGFPMHVAITLRPNQPGTSLRRLPRPTHDSLEDAIGIVCAAPDGTIVGRAAANPVVAPKLGSPGFTLLADTERRFTIDLSDALPWASIGPGTFHLEVTFVAPRTRTTAPPFAVELVDPSPDQRETLARLAPERGRAGSWGAWSRACPDDAIARGALRGPFDLRDPLRYERLWRYLVCGDDDLGSVDPALLAVLDGPHAPEADVLAAEIAWARGDRATFDAAADRVRRLTPGLAFRMDDIVNDRSEPARADAERRARREP
jgi:hypothetical protein